MSGKADEAASDAGAPGRNQALESGSSNVARYIVGGLILVAILGAAAMLFTPSAIQTALTEGASEAEDMQETAPMDVGVDTSMPAGSEVETDQGGTSQMTQTEEDPAPAQDEGDGTEARLATLEERYAALLESEESEQEFQQRLDEQEERLRQQFEREREALQEQLEEARRQPPSEISTAGVIPGVGGGDQETEAERRARERLEEERARREAIREEQINSPSVVIDGAASTGVGAGAPAGETGAGGGRDLTDNEQFMQSASTQAHETAQAGRITAPSRTIVQGTTLQAVLETAVSSELPGMIRAVVTRDVYSYDGANVLLPRGSRLIGTYNSDVSVVQGRVQMAWSRAVTPSGVSVELGGYGADRLGRSGQDGFVDSRFGARFGSAALISLIGAGPQVVISENAGENQQDIGEDVGGDLESASQGAVSDYLSAPPVIYVDQGVEMTVFVNRDLVF